MASLVADAIVFMDNELAVVADEMAITLSALDGHSRALQLVAAADVQMRERAWVRAPTDAAHIDAVLTAAKQALGPDWQAEYDRGLTVPIVEALEAACDAALQTDPGEN